MKKNTIAVCTLALILSMMAPLSVSAKNNKLYEPRELVPKYTNGIQIVPFDPNEPEIRIPKPVIPFDRLPEDEKAVPTFRRIKPLGTSGTEKLDFKKFKPYDIHTSNVNYSTNSTKIVLRVKSNIKNHMIVKLYNEADVQIGAREIQASTTSQSITFTNLVSFENYYIGFENIGQQIVDITSTVAAK